MALGRQHGARERATVLMANTASDGAAEMATLSLARWTHIVAAMSHIVTAYNVGFDRDVLSLVEDRSDPNRPVVTIQAGGESAPSLSAVLEGTLICVRSRDAQGVACEADRRLVSDRDDDQTATYILQDWMQHL